MKDKCASCKSHACYTKGINCSNLTTDEVIAAYTEDEKQIMKAAAYVEATFYSNITRLQETAEFAKAMGYKRLGMAFCIGLNDEAHYIERFFKKQGFEFYSICCKNCSVAKKELGLKQVKPELEHEAMCNPKFQAKFLNDRKVELFISCGLCVGHDAIFNANCNGPVTTLVVKDRLLAHNPLGAIYSRYWRKKLGIMDEDEV
ncbi:MAG: DUF1847 domain-containing protein [Prevotella sp.]|jgi:uncharacterized metal-binding protein|nr:DUF1847 domain-containing protein [Prevotella sp.]MCH4211993.1 DUF1847 domain-containing protein [Prevotella sp.]MCH4241282.1 DUF1847 domain-containing protein [Prevotella sp.]